MIALLKASLILGLVALNAFFVATEYALLSVRRTRLEELSNEGVPQAKLVLTLLSDMVALFSGTQLGITVISLLMGWVGLFRKPWLTTMRKDLRWAWRGPCSSSSNSAATPCACWTRWPAECCAHCNAPPCAVTVLFIRRKK